MLTLPNLLTLSRIFAVPILVSCCGMRAGWLEYGVTFVLYCLVGITDYFDGYLARAQGTVSRLGQFLDPIADKIMVGRGDRHADRAPVAGRRAIIADWHLIPALIILLREIIVSGLREFLGQPAGLGPGQPARQMEDDAAAGLARRADPRRRAAAMAVGAAASAWSACGARRR